MLDALVNDERVSDETRKYVLTTHCRTLKGRSTFDGMNTETRHRYGNWQDMYPKFLDAFAAAKNGNGLNIFLMQQKQSMNLLWLNIMKEKIFAMKMETIII